MSKKMGYHSNAKENIRQDSLKLIKHESLGHFGDTFKNN